MGLFGSKKTASQVAHPNDAPRPKDTIPCPECERTGKVRQWGGNYTQYPSEGYETTEVVCQQCNGQGYINRT